MFNKEETALAIAAIKWGLGAGFVAGYIGGGNGDMPPDEMIEKMISDETAKKVLAGAVGQAVVQGLQ